MRSSLVICHVLEELSELRLPSLCVNLNSGLGDDYHFHQGPLEHLTKRVQISRFKFAVKRAVVLDADLSYNRFSSSQYLRRSRQPSRW